MRISLTILFVSLTTLLGVATIYTLSRSQSNEAIFQSSNDYPPCVQLYQQCKGGFFNMQCRFAIKNTCSQNNQFTITSISANKEGYDTTITSCLYGPNYDFLNIEQKDIIQITQQTCSFYD